jgi:hypothetical protein
MFMSQGEAGGVAMRNESLRYTKKPAPGKFPDAGC